MQSSFVSIAVLLLSGLAAPAQAQSRLPHHDLSPSSSPFNAGQHGSAVLGLTDWDGDGWPDYAVAAPTFETEPGRWLGRIFVYSGRRSTLIRTFDGRQHLSGFGGRLASPGDLNGNGSGDLIVAAIDHDGGFGPNGTVFALDGQTGAELWSFSGDSQSFQVGREIAITADFTGDGIPEVLVADPAWGTVGIGRMWFLNGASGLSLGEATGDFTFRSFGFNLAARPDSNVICVSDGIGDVYYVAPPMGGPAAKSLVLSKPVGSANDTARMALIERPGASGVRLAVGRRYVDTPASPNAGRVDLFELNGTPVLSFTGTFLGEGLGDHVFAAFDLDGDGDEELGFVSSTPAGGRRIRRVTQSGTVLDDLDFGPFAGTHARECTLPDVTGDGRSELLVGESNSGRGFLFSEGLTIVSAGVDGSGTLRGSFAIEGGAANANRLYLQVYGASGGSPGFLGSALYPLIPVNVDAVTLAALNSIGGAALPDALGVLDGNGRRTTNIALPPSTVASLSGLDLWSAVAIPGAGFPAVTNPVAIPIP